MGTDGADARWTRAAAAAAAALGVLVAAAVLTPLPAAADDVQARLVAGAPEDGARFGAAIALDGAAALVGAPLEDGGGGGGGGGDGADRGAAYVLRDDGAGAWTVEARLVAGDDGGGTPADGDEVGSAVALAGDLAVVGAPGADGDGEDRGAAYVFRRNGAGAWALEASLASDAPADGDRFGASVAVDADGGVVLVGTPGADGAATDAGEVHVLRHGGGGTWSREAVLVADDAGAGDAFGTAVALAADGGRALVGADRADLGGPDWGAAYVFDRATGGTWTQTARLVASDAGAGDRFGAAVALAADGDRALVGAPLEDGPPTGANRGAAYVFARGSGGGWDQQAKLVPADAADGDELGWAVALAGDGDLAVAGAPREDGSGSDRGSAALFGRDADGGGWTLLDRLAAGAPEDGARFGEAIALDGRRGLVGAPREDGGGGGGSDRGAAYVLTVDHAPTAAFSWSPTAPRTGEPVTFVDESTDAEGPIAAWAWDLGDGNVSAASAPTHAFGAPGTYAVCLTVTDDAGANATACQDLVVLNAPPEAAFDASPAADPPRTLAFADRSTDPDGAVVAWSWRFGDGATGQGPGPNHTYAADGTYTVCLNVTDDDGATGGTCRDVVVGPVPPDAAFAVDPDPPRSGVEVRFLDASTDADGTVEAWAWDLGDGADAALAEVAHVYADDGTYRVCLTVTDDAGLSDTACRNVTLLNSPPTVSIVLAPHGGPEVEGPFEAGAEVPFRASGSDPDGSIVACRWMFGDGATGTGCEPVHAYAEPGDHEVGLLAVDDDGDEARASRTVTVVPARPVPFPGVGWMLAALGAAAAGAAWLGRGGADRRRRG